MEKSNKFIEKIKRIYNHYPKLVLFIFIILSYILILIQSYFALPRNILIVFFDTWELLLFIIPLCLIVLKLKVKDILGLGIFYFLLGISIGFFKFPNFIKIEYATISFLAGIWFIGEWFNYKKFNKSLLSELMDGNYNLAIGLFLSTIVLGIIVEFLNAPAGLWWYRWPFPSIEVLGIPIFLAAFGWFPWIFAMFIFLYPYALKDYKKL